MPVLDLAAGWEGLKEFFAALSLDNYATLFSDSLYAWSYWKSLQVAAISTAILLLIAYPVAYALARAPRRWQGLLVLLVVLPFWTSFLIRVYAWMNILQHDGLLNQALVALRIVDAPVTWLATDTAVYIGIVYSYFPFMVLPLYAALEKMDDTLLEAAADLGSPPWRTFFQVTVPLSLPGIVAGSLLCFIPIVGEFVIPDLLGSSSTAMIGQTLWTGILRQPRLAGRLRARRRAAVHPGAADPDLPPARSAPFGGDAMKRFSTINLAALALGLAFLYLPIAILVIYSFNDSRLVTVWGGASLRWYRALFNDSAMLEAASVSLRVAFLSATAATVLGTLAALALTPALPRQAPVLRHDLCAAGDAGSHHRPVAAAPVRRARVRPRLLDHRDRAHDADALLRRGGGAVAARSPSTGACRKPRWTLAVRRCARFCVITLPLIWPAVASGWMLAFALSLDDLVLASFVTGPGATTLPLRIYSEVRLGVKPEINAVCTIMIAVVAVGLIAASLLTKRSAASAQLGGRV